MQGRVGVALLAVLAMGAAGCTAASADSGSVLDEEQLVIGTSYNQPGIGLETESGEFEGLDVDIANYIADELGFEERDVKFIKADPDEREELLT